MSQALRVEPDANAAVRASGRRAIAGLRDFADQLDAAGLRPLGTTALNEAREIESMLVAAMQRLERANDQGER